MNDLNTKKRLGILIGVLFLYIPLAIAGLWMTIHLVEKYFTFPDSVNFSSFVVYGAICFLILLPLIILSAYPIFMGVPIPASTQKKLGKYVAVCLGLAIVSQISVKFYFEQAFEVQGYVACSGTPHSWTPGMATRYVKDIRLCRQ